MNVLLVYPNINGFHEDNYHFGVASLVSVCREAGHNVKATIVGSIDDYEVLVEEVKEFEPSVVGFSSVSSQFNFVKAMAARVKAQAPDVLTLCGGVHPTLAPDALLESDDLDGFFMGESEHALVEFLDKVENGLPYRDTDNFAYVRDGEVVKNPLRPLVQNLDELPFPDKEIYPYEETVLNRRYAPFFFTRGCPYICTYCSNQAIAKTYGRPRNLPRFRSPESCIREIETTLEKYHDLANHVVIGDDIFGLNTEWRREFCEKYTARVLNRFGKKFMILMRVEMINEKLVSMLKAAGCFKVFFGVESGNEEMRKRILRRDMSNQTIIDAFDLCHRYGLETLAVNIIGFPGETEEMIKDTISLNRRLNPTISGVNIYYPYSGTELGNQCFDDGLVDLEKFETFSNERRETVLNYDDDQKTMLSYYYANWPFLVKPYDLRIRLNRARRGVRDALATVGLLDSVRNTKKLLLYPLRSKERAAIRKLREGRWVSMK